MPFVFPWAAVFDFLFGWALKSWRNRGPSPLVQEAEKAGKAQAEVDAATHDAAVEAAIAQAEANAPKSDAEVVDALKRGEF